MKRNRLPLGLCLITQGKHLGCSKLGCILVAIPFICYAMLHCVNVEWLDEVYHAYGLGGSLLVLPVCSNLGRVPLCTGCAVKRSAYRAEARVVELIVDAISVILGPI